jgi:hypothetical protein
MTEPSQAPNIVPFGKYKGSWNKDDPDRPRWNKDTNLVAEYDYCRADGSYAYTVRKGLNPNDEKCFIIARRNSMSFSDMDATGNTADWIWGQGDEPSVLFRLPELIAATKDNPGCRVLIPEGEKDVMTAVELGYIATCNPGGVFKWKDEFAPYLTGSESIIIPDKDEVGRQHASKISTSISGYAKRVGILSMPDGFKDLTEWKEAREKAGLTKEAIKAELDALIEVVTPAHRDFTEEQWREIRRLASLSPVQYDRERKEAANLLDVRLSTLDTIVDGLRPKKEEDAKGTPISFPELEPWHEQVEGEKLIEDLTNVIKKHVALSDEQALTTSFWILHAHAREAAEHFPRLHLESPVKRCGKTTLMNTVFHMVPRALETEFISKSALFRLIEEYQPTMLIDEVDSFLHDNEEMRGLLNAGHTRNGTTIISIPMGDGWEPRQFKVSGPTVIAGIGRIPETLEDRSITIHLKRRLKNEKIERLRSNRTEHLSVIGRRAARWVSDNIIKLINSDPELPNELNDRQHDNWRPLIAIADAISKDMGEKAREAAKVLSKEIVYEDDSAGIMLLADVADIIKEVDTTAEDIVKKLITMNDRPWPKWRKGEPLTKTSLARLLKPFHIKPKIMWEEKTVKKYLAKEIQDAKDRYVDGVFQAERAMSAIGAKRTPLSG